jgi:hypothetical protein
MLIEERRAKWKGGKTIDKAVIRTTGESNGQWFAGQDRLQTRSKVYTENISFKMKKAQVPIVYDGDVELQNQTADDDAKKMDVVELLTKQALMGCKQMVETALHATTAAGDSGKQFQGVPEACDHSRTYGGYTSSTTTATKWWNGASLDASYTDRATSMSLSLYNLRLLRAKCMMYGEVRQNQRFYLFLGDALHSKLMGELESRGVMTNPGKLAKYGFTSAELYGNIEVVLDPYMTLNMSDDILLVNPASWDLWLHPKRSFTITDFTDQKKISGGKDQYLARCLLAGNSVCWQPNSNAWKSTVV